MALFDDITKKAAKFTEEAIDKTQELAGVAKVKLKIKNVESERDDVYRDLGKYYLSLIKDENSVDEEVVQMRIKIHEYDSQIEELNEELKKIDED